MTGTPLSTRLLTSATTSPSSGTERNLPDTSPPAKCPLNDVSAKPMHQLQQAEVHRQIVYDCIRTALSPGFTVGMVSAILGRGHAGAGEQRQPEAIAIRAHLRAQERRSRCSPADL